MPQIHQTYKIHAPIAKVWEALVTPKIIDGWGAGPKVKMRAEEGFEFSLWDGDIYGTNTRVMAPKLLEQNWYGGDWDKPSKVVFRLSEDKGVTTVELSHDDLPRDEVKEFADGWEDYYLGKVKVFLES